MPSCPRNYPFYNWVPKPIGIIILLFFFLPILSVGGVYSVNSTEMKMCIRDRYAPHQLLIGSDDGLSSFNTSTGEHKLYSYDEVNPSSLSNRFVYPIMKDREGGVWIGTYYGGVNYISPNTGQFESYSQSRFFNSVKGSIISHFCEDTNGNIWIASDDGGLTCLSTADNRFIHYMPQEGRNSLSYHNVHALCMDCLLYTSRCV